MKRSSLWMKAACLTSAFSLMLAANTVIGAPVAGVSGLSDVNIASELTSSSPASGITLLLSKYLTESNAYADSLSKTTTVTDTVQNSGEQVVSKVRIASVDVASEEIVDETQDDVQDEAFAGVYAVAQVDGYVNIRKKADADSEVLGKLYDECVGTIIKKNGEWYKIESGSVKGYVHQDYVVIDDDALLAQVGTRTATVVTETLRVREKADIESTILGLVPQTDVLVVVSESKDGWVKVEIEGGEGYVSAEYVTLETIYKQAESREEEAARLEKEAREREEANRRAAEAERQQAAGRTQHSSSSSSSSSSNRDYSAPSGSNGQAVANYASQFVGNPYVYGGTSLTNGADCSGFVMSVYRAFGVTLPRTSYSQRSCGYGVSLSEIQPGDIVCYSGHVGIYVGNNTIVHASNARTGIKFTSPVTYRSVLAVRRIF